VKPRSSAPPSPPTSSKRRLATVDDPAAIAMSSPGPMTWNWSPCAPIVEVSRWRLRWNVFTDHGCTVCATGTNQPYDRPNVASSLVRERPSTPFASTTGEGCGVW
jgi:hypothetical protein